MSITECFQMRKRRSVDKTPGRNDQGKLERAAAIGLIGGFTK